MQNVPPEGENETAVTPMAVSPGDTLAFSPTPSGVSDVYIDVDSDVTLEYDDIANIDDIVEFGQPIDPIDPFRIQIYNLLHCIENQVEESHITFTRTYATTEETTIHALHLLCQVLDRIYQVLERRNRIVEFLTRLIRAMDEILQDMNRTNNPTD